MRSPRKFSKFNALALGTLLGLAVTGGRVQAGPPPVPKAVVIPDYGARDTPGGAMAAGAASGPDVGLAAPNPLAQAWRACEALALVLGGIVAAVYGLKRFGIVRDGDPKLHWGRGLTRPVSSAGPLAVVSSQPLPGGGMLHVVSVAGRTLLLAATAQAVSLIAELSDEPQAVTAAPPPAEEAAFGAYLSHAGMALPPESPVAAATDRLKSLLARSQGTGNP